MCSRRPLQLSLVFSPTLGEREILGLTATYAAALVLFLIVNRGPDSRKGWGKTCNLRLKISIRVFSVQ